ncbi:Oligosaccharide translocation protein rft1 [Entomortierella beljakovae]|nr:Oligosaccharide translocation protein rft1 [Entomortierella beljakovae]
MESSGLTLRQRSVPSSSKHSDSIPNENNNGKLKSTGQASSILSSSVQGASYLVLLQFVSRMLTFSLNQVLLRYTKAETLGIASVQLELLLNTILFLSREGVRCAAIRVSDDPEEAVEPESEYNDNKSVSTATLKPGSEAYKIQKLVNMVYAPIPVGALMTCLVVGFFLSHVDDESESKFPGYRLSIYLYGLSALIELLSEPMFMVAQYRLWFRTRVSVEGTAVLTRCLLTCALTIYGARSAVIHHESMLETNNKNTMGVLAFAIAQLAYAILILAGFMLAFWGKSTERRNRDRQRVAAAEKKYLGHKSPHIAEEIEDQIDDFVSLKALFPRKLAKTRKDGKQEYFFFDKHLLKLSKTLTAQSLLKHVLTEGDKMLMTGFTTETDQGIYAFVLNYGSLIARILFQPMEEISRTLFSKLLSDIIPASTQSSTSETKSEASVNTHNLTEAQRGNLVLSRNLLLTIMKFHILLGSVFIAFGTHYTATLIDLVVGRYWSQTFAPAVLSLYCWYVPIMGINGITEAVVQAVASEKELGILSYWMVGFSAIFCGTGAFLMGVMGLGAKGIVLANCVNLSVRIAWSMWFLSGYYGRYIPVESNQGKHSRFSFVPWQNIIPQPLVIAAFGAAYAITAASEQYIGWSSLYNKAMHLGVGVATFATVMGVVFVKEKQFIRDIQNIVRQRRQ